MKSNKLKVETTEYSYLTIESTNNESTSHEFFLKDCVFEIKDDVVELNINYCDGTFERNPIKFKTKPFVIDYSLVIAIEKKVKSQLKKIQKYYFSDDDNRKEDCSKVTYIYNENKIKFEIYTHFDGIRDFKEDNMMYSILNDMRFTFEIPFKNKEIDLTLDFEFHKLHLILDFIKLYKKRYLKSKMF